MEGTRIAEILRGHRECYASCNRSHPHCANYIHGSQDVWPCEEFELATLAAQAERYREELEKYKLRDRLDEIVVRHNSSRGFSHFNNGYDCEACYRAYSEAGLLEQALARGYIEPKAEPGVAAAALEGEAEG